MAAPSFGSAQHKIDKALGTLDPAKRVKLLATAVSELMEATKAGLGSPPSGPGVHTNAAHDPDFAPVHSHPVLPKEGADYREAEIFLDAVRGDDNSPDAGIGSEFFPYKTPPAAIADTPADSAMTYRLRGGPDLPYDSTDPDFQKFPFPDDTAWELDKYHKVKGGGADQRSDKAATVLKFDVAGYAMKADYGTEIHDLFGYNEHVQPGVGVSNVTWLAGVLTVTCTADHGLKPGGVVKLTGVICGAPNAANATYHVSATPSSTQWQALRDANPGTYTSGGTSTEQDGDFYHVADNAGKQFHQGYVFDRSSRHGLRVYTASIDNCLYVRGRHNNNGGYGLVGDNGSSSDGETPGATNYQAFLAEAFASNVLGQVILTGRENTGDSGNTVPQFFMFWGCSFGHDSIDAWLGQRCIWLRGAQHIFLLPGGKYEYGNGPFSGGAGMPRNQPYIRAEGHPVTGNRGQNLVLVGQRFVSTQITLGGGQTQAWDTDIGRVLHVDDWDGVYVDRTCDYGGLGNWTAANPGFWIGEDTTNVEIHLPWISALPADGFPALIGGPGVDNPSHWGTWYNPVAGERQFWGRPPWTRYKSGAGAAFSDADFVGGAHNGLMGVAHDTTSGLSYIYVRANGTWKKVQVT